MQRSLPAPHPTGVSTIATVPTSHAELKEQYAVALRVWSDAKRVYGFTSHEVLAATKLVDELELQLSDHAPARIGLKP